MISAKYRLGLVWRNGLLASASAGGGWQIQKSMQTEECNEL